MIALRKFLCFLFVVSILLPQGALGYGHVATVPVGSILPSGGSISSQGASGSIEVNREGSPVRARLSPPGDSARAPPEDDGLATPHAAELETPSTFFEDVTDGRASTTRSSAGAAARVTHRGTRETRAIQVEGFTQEGDTMEIEKAEHLEYGDIKGEKVIGFEATGDGTITITQADRIEIPDGILTKVQSFQGHEIKFRIGSAQDVLLGCIMLKQVRDTDFTINEKNIIIEPAQGVEFDIADCGFSQNHFKAYSENSKITISKSQRAHYEITQGELECKSLESAEILQANASSSVQYGSNCFSCMDLEPSSIYWYNSKNLVQDFAMNVPNEGEKFKLCLKKQPLDHFTNYDGLVDFIDKEISLTKKIKYLRYPLKDSTIASLLMEDVIEDKDNATIKMKLDDELIFIDEVNIRLNGPMNNVDDTIKFLKTITNPNNFIQVREKSIENNETHRLLRIERSLPKTHSQQSRIHSYATEYFEPKITISNNVLAQQGTDTVIRVLPLEDSNIGWLLE